MELARLENANNQRYFATAIQRLNQMLCDAAGAGFYGKIGVELTIQNGQVQHMQEHQERRHQGLEKRPQGQNGYPKSAE
jgi:hypothetical protein